VRSVFFPSLVNGAFGDPALYVRLAHRREALLFDCGDLHRLTPRDALKVREIFISHAHIDHLIGFDALVRLFLYQDAGLTLYGPEGIIDRIAGRLAGYTWNLVEGYPFGLTVREWGANQRREVFFSASRGFRLEEKGPWVSPGGRLIETEHYRVRAEALDHGDIPSLAFALEEPLHVAIHKDALEKYGYAPGPWLTRFKDRLRGGAHRQTPVPVPLRGGGETVVSMEVLSRRIAHLERGMKVTYVTDADPSPENQERICALAADSHLLVIEAPFAHKDLDRARRRNHLTAHLAGELGRRAGAARLLVFHHSPRYQDTPKLLAEEAQKAFQQMCFSTV
jgi:ribonuclease Z